MTLVYLVGAGPGDPGLLTVRAAELLRSVDVVAHDELISPAILSQVGPGIELISVGYRGYGSSKLGYRMHPAIIERALQGKTVVRLKSGDPLIFGRTVQECEELIENGIPFEIVPGITSGMGAAAYAGIPLTHRSCASDVIITSGHDLRGGSQSNSNWEALGKSTGTILIYMASSKIRENCDRLIASGRDPNTAAAFIADATRASQRVVTGTLLDLSEKVGVVNKSTPALIVVGNVVNQRSPFNWFIKKPLNDVSAMIVRSRSGQSRIAQLLKEQGSDIIEVPRIWTEELGESTEEVAEELFENSASIYTAIDSAIGNISNCGNLIFSCEEGVSFFLKRMLILGFDSRKLQGIQIVAMGNQVRNVLARHGIAADLVLSGHCLESVSDKAHLLRKAAQVGPSERQTFVITSKRGRPNLFLFLEKLSITAKVVSAYRYRHQFPTFSPPHVDFVILPSSSSASLLLDGPWREHYLDTPMLVLGPVTRDAALKMGAKNVYQSETDHIEDLIPLIKRLKIELKGISP